MHTNTGSPHGATMKTVRTAGFLYLFHIVVSNLAEALGDSGRNVHLYGTLLSKVQGYDGS